MMLSAMKISFVLALTLGTALAFMGGAPVTRYGVLRVMPTQTQHFDIAVSEPQLPGPITWDPLDAYTRSEHSNEARDYIKAYKVDAIQKLRRPDEMTQPFACSLKFHGPLTLEEHRRLFTEQVKDALRDSRQRGYHRYA